MEKEIYFLVVGEDHGDVCPILSLDLLGKFSLTKVDKEKIIELEGTKFYQDKDVFKPCNLPSKVIRNALLHDVREDEASIDKMIEKNSFDVMEIGKAVIPPVHDYKSINIDNEELKVTVTEAIMGKNWFE